MNEANSPFNESGLPESADVAGSIWEDAYRELLEGENLAEPLPHPVEPSAHEAARPESSDLSSSGEVPPTAADDWQAWQTLDFPNAISADAIERQSLYAEPSNDAQPNVADLISLIQELNQCNNILLDRVSQLEDALERSQTALKSEVERSRAQQAMLPNAVQELMSAQEQIVQLSNQLEFVQQTSQRQQIRIETLTAQLESSQERVAQLEREAALAQQRFEQQSHIVAQTETVCRDLQARLQRQQRYTLQFKAALERCLEVPPPNYESLADTELPSAPASTRQDVQDALAGSIFLPKSQRIQPWSFRDLLAAEPLTAADYPVKAADDFNTKLRSAIDAEQIQLCPEAVEKLGTDSQTDSQTDFQAEFSATASEAAIADPAATDQLKSLSYDIRANSEPQVSHPVPSAMAENSSEGATNPDKTSEELDLQSILNSLAAGNLSNSELAAAEETLWQDLAKLIDASAEDIAKVSAAETFTDFATTNQDGVESEEVTTKARTPDAEERSAQPPELDKTEVDAPQMAQPKPSTIDLPAMLASTLQSARQTVAQQSSEAQNRAPAPALPGVLTASSTWPSPIVYPLRPPKKRASLAAVDLPTFPRVGS